MHSTIMARARYRLAALSTWSCSRIDGEPVRRIGRSEPSGRSSRGEVPVVLATAGTPASRSADQMSRATVDFPRVPFTWMRMGTPRQARSRA